MLPVNYLQSKDLSLVHSMIPLGSCTMKVRLSDLTTGISSLYPATAQLDNKHDATITAWLLQHSSLCSSQPNIRLCRNHQRAHERFMQNYRIPCRVSPTQLRRSRRIRWPLSDQSIPSLSRGEAEEYLLDSRLGTRYQPCFCYHGWHEGSCRQE